MKSVLFCILSHNTNRMLKILLIPVMCWTFVIYTVSIEIDFEFTLAFVSCVNVQSFFWCCSLIKQTRLLERLHLCSKLGYLQGLQSLCTAVVLYTALFLFSFSGDYSNALLHYEKGVTKLPEVSRILFSVYESNYFIHG